MEGDADDTGLAGDSLAAPREVAGIETEGAELAVAAAGADEMDAFTTDTGVGGLAAFLERSGESPYVRNIGFSSDAFRVMHIPLLAVVCALCAGGCPLMTGVTRDTVTALATV
jgi:hypothetical protein